MRLVHFRISEAHVFKAKMFTSGLSLFYSPFETCFLEVKAICNSFQKENNKETTHTRNGHINITHAQHTAVIPFDFPSFLRQSSGKKSLCLKANNN